MAIQKSVIGKKATDFELITYAYHLNINTEQALEIFELLKERYSIKSQRVLDVILDRVQDALRCKKVKNEIVSEFS